MKEILRLKTEITKIEKNLLNEDFIKKAPQKVIDLNNKKRLDFLRLFGQEVQRVKDTLRQRFDYENNVTAEERILWHIQWLRDIKHTNFHDSFINGSMDVDYSECEFDQRYFDYVYNSKIEDEELAELCDLTDFRTATK